MTEEPIDILDNMVQTRIQEIQREQRELHLETERIKVRSHMLIEELARFQDMKDLIKKHDHRPPGSS